MKSGVGALPTQRIDALLRTAAETHGDRTALMFGDDALGYQALDERATALGAALATAGGAGSLAGGNRIVVIAPNVPALVIAMFAGWSLGAVVVPLSARLREHELRHAIADAEPVAVVSLRSHAGYPFRDLLSQLLPDLPSVRACLVVDALGVVEEELAGPAAAEPEPLDDPAVGAIFYTSGTTGVPKGALVGHRRELEAAGHLADALGLQLDDVTLLVIPISHAFGFTCLLANIAAGATAVLVDSTFSSQPLLEALERRRATVLHGSPSLFSSLLKSRAGGVLGLRTGFVGGAAAPPELFERLEGLGTRILNVYGLTETGAVSCCRLDDPSEVRYRTAGSPLPGLEVRLSSCDEDGLGELQVRGPAVTRGYYRRPAETTEAFEDGWFRTGDLALLEDGRVRIAGRAKELVHVAGFNVFPAEVEGVLLTHPDVAQVVIVGIPHATMGEVLQAFIVPRSGADLTPAALLRFARQKIAGYKLPYAISICAELPMLASGKPDRRALSRSALLAAASKAGA